jgi:hypothetical protein
VLLQSTFDVLSACTFSSCSMLGWFIVSMEPQNKTTVTCMGTVHSYPCAYIVEVSENLAFNKDVCIGMLK